MMKFILLMMSLKDLAKEVRIKVITRSVPDGFFWGQQFQEEAVKEYKSQDLKFLKFCKEAIKDGKTVVVHLLVVMVGLYIYIYHLWVIYILITV